MYPGSAGTELCNRAGLTWSPLHYFCYLQLLLLVNFGCSRSCHITPAWTLGPSPVMPPTWQWQEFAARGQSLRCLTMCTWYHGSSVTPIVIPRIWLKSLLLSILVIRSGMHRRPTWEIQRQLGDCCDDLQIEEELKRGVLEVSETRTILWKEAWRTQGSSRLSLSLHPPPSRIVTFPVA